MSGIKILIETENAAFEEGEEICRILRKLANDLEEGKNVEKLLDINGNQVGYVEKI